MTLCSQKKARMPHALGVKLPLPPAWIEDTYFQYTNNITEMVLVTVCSRSSLPRAAFREKIN